MPIPAGAVRVTINGAYSNGEVLTHTLHLSPSGDPNGDEPSVIADQAARRVRDRWVALLGRQFFSSALMGTLTYTSVQAYSLDALGHAVAQAQANFDPGMSGHGSGVVLPNQVAMCVTLRTNTAGRTGRGRMYLGGLSGSVLTNTGRFDKGACASMAAEFATFAVDLRTPGASGPAGGHRFDLCVASPKASALRVVTGIAIGDVPDVQRRRRDRLVEAYSGAPVAA